MEDVFFFKVTFDGTDPNNDVFPAVSAASVQANNLPEDLTWGTNNITPADAANHLNINATVGEVLVYYKLRSSEGGASNYILYGRVPPGYTQSSLTNYALIAFTNLSGLIIESGGGGQNDNNGNGSGGNRALWIGGGLLLLLLLMASGKKEEEEPEPEPMLLRGRRRRLISQR